MQHLRSMPSIQPIVRKAKVGNASGFSIFHFPFAFRNRILFAFPFACAPPPPSMDSKLLKLKQNSQVARRHRAVHGPIMMVKVPHSQEEVPQPRGGAPRGRDPRGAIESARRMHSLRRTLCARHAEKDVVQLPDCQRCPLARPESCSNYEYSLTSA